MVRAEQVLSETVQFHFAPMKRGTLWRLMDQAGYPQRGFGSGDFIANSKPAIDCDPLPDDLAEQCFDAFEANDPRTAHAIVTHHFSRAT